MHVVYSLIDRADVRIRSTGAFCPGSREIARIGERQKVVNPWEVPPPAQHLGRWGWHPTPAAGQGFCRISDPRTTSSKTWSLVADWIIWHWLSHYDESIYILSSCVMIVLNHVMMPVNVLNTPLRYFVFSKVHKWYVYVHIIYIYICIIHITYIYIHYMYTLPSPSSLPVTFQLGNQPIWRAKSECC